MAIKQKSKSLSLVQKAKMADVVNKFVQHPAIKMSEVAALIVADFENVPDLLVKIKKRIQDEK